MSAAHAALKTSKNAIKRTIDPTGRGATRGAPVGRYPYIVYRTVEAEEVWVTHIRHGARRAWRG